MAQRGGTTQRGEIQAGRGGRGGFTSMVLGSTSLQCVLHAQCPVTVVEAARVPEASAVPAASHAFMV